MLMNNYFVLCLVLSNVKELSEQFQNGFVEDNLMPSFNYSDPSSVLVKDYREWFKKYGPQLRVNLTDCDPQKEMEKVKTNVNKM